MATRYFRLTDDMTVPERWELGTPIDTQGQELGSWLFMFGEPTHVDDRLRIPIRHPGKALDFSLIQLFPGEVDSRPEAYFLVNVVRIVKCIDDAASEEVRYWKREDGEPEKVGQYRAVYGMRIDTSKVGGRQGVPYLGLDSGYHCPRRRQTGP